MTPVRNNVLLRPYPADEISEGGIYVPESARKESNKMYEVAVGTGIPSKPMRLKAGQTVYRVKDWGTPVDIKGERHYIMDQAAIIATE